MCISRSAFTLPGERFRLRLRLSCFEPYPDTIRERKDISGSDGTDLLKGLMFDENASAGDCPRYTYCLFVRTGREDELVKLIMNEQDCTVLVPRIENEICVSGRWENKKRLMLPGYLFIYSESEINFLRVLALDGALKVLQYEDRERDLRGDDRRFAEWLYKHKGTLGISKAIKEGTKIRIVGGPLLDYAGSILEVKRQKRLAKVKITVGNQTRDIWMSFEWLEPDEERN